MPKPTQEQIREFWEWYGFTEEYWDGEWFWVHPNSPPTNRITSKELPIDLNNLFKYVPSSGRITLSLWRKIVREWVPTLTGDYVEDTLALFSAIMEVKE